MYDYIVIGLGCSGASTLKKLSEDDNDILGIDSYGIPNDKGSSHGNSRIYRLSYYEGEKYLPLLKESYEMWKDLENKVDYDLLVNNGFLFLSDDTRKRDKCLNSCEKANIEYKLLSKNDINNEFKEWNIKNSEVQGIYHKYGGLLKSKKVLEAFRDISLENGVDLVNNKVNEVIPKRDSVKVKCDNNTFKGKGVVIKN